MVLNLDRKSERPEQNRSQNEDLMRNKRIAKKVFWKRDLVLDLDREIRTEQKSEQRLGIAKRCSGDFGSELDLELG